MAEKSLDAHLFECLKEGNTKKALYIIKLLGDKVNTLYRGKSPLCWAKEFENDEVARALEEKRAVEEVISDEEAKKLGIKLVEKARVGDLDAVIELVGKGAKVDEKDIFGDTALILASKNGHVEVVKTLIENGAKVDEKNDRGNTALIWASRNDYVKVIKALLDAGAKVDEKDNYGETALMSASQYGYIDVVKTLLDKGADVSIKNKYGDTAMSLAKDEETRRAILNAVKLKKQKDKENKPSFMDRVKGLFGKGE